MKWLKNLISREEQASAAEAATPQAEAGNPRTLRPGTPQFHLSLAEAVLKQGKELDQGAQHLARLLAFDPTRPEWLALIERYAKAARWNTDSLVPDQEPRHFSTEALRAYFWQMRGRTIDAIDHLAQVSQASGQLQYLHGWVLGWLEPKGMVEVLPETPALRLFSCLLAHCDEAYRSSTRDIRHIRRWSALFERWNANRTPHHFNLMISAGLLRRSGYFDAALKATGPIESARDANHAIAIGLTLRRKRLYAEAAKAFAKAQQLEPDNINGYIEAGDNYLDAREWQKALMQYASALRREPGHIWAEPSAWFCRWKISRAEEAIQRIRALAKEGNACANLRLRQAFDKMDTTFDLSARTIRQIRAECLRHPGQAPDGELLQAMSRLAAPSNQLALDLELAALKLAAVRVEPAAGPASDPDPRRAIAEIEHPLWRYDGPLPQPALPEPAPEVSARVAALASEPYDREVNWARASHVAAMLGPDKALDVLAVMVHPPALPAGREALEWLPRVQLVAAQIIAQIDEGWAQSQRRRLLLSALYGPWDWTTCAAIRALAWIAREEPVHALEIHEAFEKLGQCAPSGGQWDWVGVLYKEWRTLPFLLDEERAALQKNYEGFKRLAQSMRES